MEAEMNRMAAIGAGVLGGVALVGAGVAAGSLMAEDSETQVVSAAAQGPITEADQPLLVNFGAATNEFESLLVKARDGKKVGDQLTQQAVVVLNLERVAQGTDFKDILSATGDAMLLLGAGVTSDDGATVEEGLNDYQEAQQQILELAEEVNGGPISGSDLPTPDTPAAPAETTE
ncbi:MAG: hypothetical protein K0U64_01690 [Actinomycetia bacterium]|nr:hypothetical protein [Actinomycetes bacterium]